MKIKSIRIIGMHKVKDQTYDFNDFNYLYGKNGAGKSTVLQAIQLAILGFIPGTDKNKTAIFRHANSKFMQVTLTFDSEATIMRSWDASGKDIKVEEKITPIGFNLSSMVSQIELPIFNFNEFINLSANKLKDWFINFLPDDAINIDIADELKPDLCAVGGFDANIMDNTMAKIYRFTSTGILDTVRQFNAYCKDMISLYKKESERLQSTIQNLIHYNEVDTSIDEEQLRADIRQAEIELENVQGRIYKLKTISSITNKLSDIKDQVSAESVDKDATYLDISNKVEDLTDKIAQAEQGISTINGSIQVNQAELNRLTGILSGQGVCPYSKQLCDSIVEKLDPIRSEADTLLASITADKQKLNEVKANLLGYNQYLSELRQQRDQIASAYRQYEDLKHKLSELNIEPIAESDLEAQELAIKDKIGTLRSTLEQVIANKEYDKRADQLTSDKYKADMYLDLYKRWEKTTSVNGLQNKIMVQPFDAFADKISEYLTRFFGIDTKASFNLGEKANSFSFGIIRDGSYIHYDLLSSGEKCLFMMAMLIAISEVSDASFKLIMVDDFLDHLDDDKINNCFSTLYSISSVQTILAGVQQCDDPEAKNYVINIK